MAKKFCLMSGHTSTGGLEDIDRRMLGESNNGRVLVLNLASKDSEQIVSKGEFLTSYFMGFGAEDVDVVTEEIPENIQERFDRAGLLYLPGGDTEVFIENLQERGIFPLISSFEGVVSGNSAGAYILCPDYIQIRDEQTRLILSSGRAPLHSGIVPFLVKAHYSPEFDCTLRDISTRGEDIYGLSDVSALLWNGDFEFIGEVNRFRRGIKEKVN